MVKILLVFLLLVNVGFSADNSLDSKDLLSQKIQNLLGKKAYNKKQNFINIIFEPKSAFYINDRVDVIKVTETLKENGLLKLFFNKPQEVKLNFKTSGAPLLFLKLMGDSLRDIGYYRYVTRASSLNASEFTWNIVLTSEYATDPIVLQTQLKKSACYITDIERVSMSEWTYSVDIGNAYLPLEKLDTKVKVRLKHSLYAHWLDCSKVQKVTINSSNRNSWYPYIAYYDLSLHLLKVQKVDEKRNLMTLEIPTRAKYLKISDMYTMKNVKDFLLVSSSGKR